MYTAVEKYKTNINTMSLLYRLEEKHFGRLGFEKVIEYANQDADFCKQWLIHTIRSQCSRLELVLAIAFAQKWQLPSLKLLNSYLHEFITTEDLNQIKLDDEIFIKIQTIIEDIDTTKIHQTLCGIESLDQQKTSTLELNTYASVHRFNIPKAILKGIISSTSPLLREVTLFGDQGRSSKDKSIRNNRHYPTPLPNNLLELALVERIMVSSAGMEMMYAEPSVVLKYTPGQYYKWHYDHIYAHNPAIQQQIDQFGQRIKTAIIYLNDDFKGGNTEFKTPSLKVIPEKGKVLVFNNVDKDNNRLIESIHRGEEVTEGEKWIITLWFRDKPFWLRSGLL